MSLPPGISIIPLSQPTMSKYVERAVQRVPESLPRHSSNCLRSSSFSTRAGILGSEGIQSRQSGSSLIIARSVSRPGPAGSSPPCPRRDDGQRPVPAWARVGGEGAVTCRIAARRQTPVRRPSPTSRRRGSTCRIAARRCRSQPVDVNLPFGTAAGRFASGRPEIGIF